MSGVGDRFKGCAKAEVKTGNTPKPKLGKAAYLINQVRMADNRVSGFRVGIELTALWDIEAGKSHDGSEVAANKAGDKVSKCIFSGERFHKEFKEFALKAVGKEPHEELDIADAVCPESEYKGKSELERLEIMWEEILPGLVCAFDPDKDGAATEAGCFDGQVVLEIGTVQAKVPKLLDKKGGDVDGNRVYDATGTQIFAIYDNSYFNRKIGMEEVAEKLGEDGIKRFFGSVERFNVIKDAE